MSIAKGTSSVTLEDVLGRMSEYDILSHYLPIKELPCVIKSPLREDNRPSFGLNISADGRVHYIDYSTNEKGGLFDLLCKMWCCSFYECLTIIYNNKSIPQTIVKKREINHVVQHKRADLQCKVRDWQEHDIKFWCAFGISLNWLKWAEVYPISYIIIKKDNKQITIGADKYAYVYVEHKDKTTIKIYQPYNKKHKWSNNHDKSVISLWTKIPKEGEKLIICSSLKDALCISCQLRIPTLAIQGEGYSLSDKAVSNLKSRYKRIFISLDTDAPGILNTKRIAKETGFIPVIPDLGNTKDFSDYFKSLKNKEDFKLLCKLFS